MFRVVPDQLRVSEGWVRCGQCHEIFDALAQLHTQPLELEPEVGQPISLDSGATTALPQPEPPLQQHQLTEKVEPVLTHELSSSPAALLEPSFLREATPPKPRPMIGLLLGLAALVLTVTLLLQFVRHERSRIVAFEPATKPWIGAVCRLLACSPMPLQQIEALVLDSSSFIKIDAETYRLQFMLKNTARTMLATPAIELTLTDEQDKLLARRIFTASESGLTSLEMAASSETMGSLTIHVQALATPERIAGYRVLAFYP